MAAPSHTLAQETQPAAQDSAVQVSAFRYDPGQFSLGDTLASGQCFRWKRRSDGWWMGVVARTVIGIHQDGDLYSWWTYPRLGDEALLRDYFQFDVDHGEIVRRIAEADPVAGAAAIKWSGLRLLRQEPEECLLSFVCSTANSVPRIAYSIEQFSRYLGEHLGDVDGQPYHAFPEAAILAAADVDELTRISSLGFRGRNLVQVAGQVVERGPGWVASLRELPYEEAHRELVSLRGVGAKIADCVCLFALGKTEAVPVDTHVWQLAKALYFPDWPQRRSLTQAGYNLVAQAFRDRFRELAGYAQNFLFYEHFTQHWGGTSPLLKAGVSTTL